MGRGSSVGDGVGTRGVVEGVGTGVIVFVDGTWLVETDGAIPASPTWGAGRGKNIVIINIAATAAARMKGSSVPSCERGVLWS